MLPDWLAKSEMEQYTLLLSQSTHAMRESHESQLSGLRRQLHATETAAADAEACADQCTQVLHDRVHALSGAQARLAGEARAATAAAAESANAAREIESTYWRALHSISGRAECPLTHAHKQRPLRKHHGQSRSSRAPPALS